MMEVVQLRQISIQYPEKELVSFLMCLKSESARS